jgi:preprotein translocase subunit Sss1
MTDDDAQGPLWKKWAWFVGLWAAGVLVVGGIGYLLRWWLHP